MSKPWAQDQIEHAQRHLWAEKLAQHGDSPGAVGSESTAHKMLRYERIGRVFGSDPEFSIIDVGGGVGDFFGFLRSEYNDRVVSYVGTEITPEFCERAKRKYPGIDMRRMNILEEGIASADYVVMSGIFHQQGDIPSREWTRFLYMMIERAFEVCDKGIAFNVLSEYADYRREGNYYGNLVELQRYVVRKLSRFVIVDHAYPLFEATVCVFKSGFVQGSHDDSFKKYF